MTNYPEPTFRLGFWAIVLAGVAALAYTAWANLVGG